MTLQSRAIRVAVLATCASPWLAVHAATLTYPGAAPCNTTLQACVTGAAAGDTIQIAQNTLIAETVTVDKSLVIEPAVGFTPQVQYIFVGAAATSIDLTVRGMTGGWGVRGGLGPGGGNLTLTVENNSFTAQTFPAIEISDGSAPGSYGTLSLAARGNTITTTGSGFGCTSGISAIATMTTLAAEIVGNTVLANDLSQCAGIETVVGNVGGGSARIYRNTVRGANFDAGILMRHFGANVGVATTPLVGTAAGNLIVGQNGNVGAPGGIVLSADGNNAALQAQVINNTVALGRTGVLASARTDLGGNISGQIANNVVVQNSNYDIGIDTGLALLANDHNLVTALGGTFVPGAGTLVGDPRFVDPAGGNFRLLSDSPAINTGRNSALPVDYTIDLDSAARTQQAIVDLGAYESAFAPPIAAAVPVPTTGRTALAILAGLLAALLVATHVLRRPLG